MPTVKGDVHDIGKNIVGVVLQCNNYEVLDLGVMVPADVILETAEKENADIIGLSGLITPSLEEMRKAAALMKERGMKQPLLIGGATTSAIHTAVKIAPEYDQPVVHVRDASLSTGITAALMSESATKDFTAGLEEEHKRLREQYRSRNTEAEFITLAEARKKRFRPDFSTPPPIPEFTGLRVFRDYPLETLRKYIDWSFFFRAWELDGRYPEIFNDPEKGPEAVKLYDDARAMLDRIISSGTPQSGRLRSLPPRGIYR